MLKRAVRAGVRLAHGWLSETEKPPHVDYGKPPYLYEDANAFCKQIVRDRGLRRPHYAWGAVQAMNLAKVIGIPRISFIEFGVAGGNGLTALEGIAEALIPEFGVEVEIYGFDAVSGMPKTQDYRDLPNLWREGFYPMDPAKLKQKLTRAKLQLGAVEETVPTFLKSGPAPIGFIAFDLCFYSSTIKALRVLEGDPAVLMPRIHCFFRNVLALSLGDFNGERLAMSEFNASHTVRKISKIYGLEYFLGSHVGRWVDQY